MTREEIFINVGLHYLQYNSNYWDTLDDIEVALADIWRCTKKQANERLVRLYKSGRKSCYKKGELLLFPNWRDYLQHHRKGE